MKRRNRATVFPLAVLALLSMEAASASAQAATSHERETTYAEYLGRYSSAPRPSEEIVISAASYIDASPDVRIVEGVGGFEGTSVLTGEAGYVEWAVDLRGAALYSIEVSYYPTPGRGASVERELAINGERPFSGAEYLTFPRIWADGMAVRHDVDNNEIRSPQVERPRWEAKALCDSQGYELEPYRFYLEAGRNRIRLTSLSETMAIRFLRLYRAEQPPGYAELEKSYRDSGYEAARDVIVKLQERDATAKSSSMLSPLFDQGDPTAEPYDPALVRLNAIGGYRWVSPGEWIGWQFDVPQNGLYKIAIKAKQDELRGLYSSRRLSIDGKTPYAEVEAIRFPFSQSYRMYAMGAEGDREAGLFYLTRGTHELRLEVVLGDMSTTLREAEDILYDLNTIYRRIIMVTSPTPDALRSYQLATRIPEVIDQIRVETDRLLAIADGLERLTGDKGGQVALLNRLAVLTKTMYERPSAIPRVLSEYRDNTSALAAWIVDTKYQSLTIDYIVIASPEQTLPTVDTSIARILRHEAAAFIASFTHDYSRVGSMAGSEQNGGHKLKVWTGSGREQAQILKDMIEDSFTPTTGIRVDLELVQSVAGKTAAETMGNLLLPSLVSGRAPDVALGAANMDLAFRGAAVDLTQFPDFPEVASRFFRSALVPYRFRDGVYALPEIQAFPMLFYRKDILDELGLEVPQTWDDVYAIIPELQRNNLDIGIPADIGTFLMLLYQKGVAFYKEDCLATNLDSEATVASFSQLTDLFTLYGLPLKYNLENRFRLGEMPLIIDYYGLFNLLTVFAPELRGEWGFTLVPGTRMPDGSINRTVAVTALEAPPGEVAPPVGTSGALILSQTKNKEACWEFLKWWTSAETQQRFGREMESLMGAAARYATANKEAFMLLPWNTEQRKLLLEQWGWTEGVPSVLGSYDVLRRFDWLFRAVVIRNEPLRETIRAYNRLMNEEIARKRKEFGLPTATDELPQKWKDVYWEQYTHVHGLE